jgi:hypothetical protein
MALGLKLLLQFFSFILILHSGNYFGMKKTMNKKIGAAILASFFCMSNVYAEMCPANSDWLYQKNSAWALSKSVAQGWSISKQSINDELITDPAETVVRMEVGCGIVYCSDVSCKYYKPFDLSSPIMTLHSVNASYVNWDSIKNYIIEYGFFSNAMACQTLATNTSVCSWRWKD